MRLKLDRIATGSKSKFVKTDQGVFVCDIEKDYETFDADSGKLENCFCILDGNKDVLLKNIYHISDFTRSSNSFGTSYEKTHYSSIAQWENVAIGLTSLSDMGITYNRYDDVFGGTKPVQHGNILAVYPPSGMINEDDENLKPIWILSGVDFNFLEESPVEFEYYDFRTGVMYSNGFNMKNMYNNDWTVESTVVTSNVLSACSGTIGHTRYYTDINSDGDQVIYDVYRYTNEYEAPSAGNIPYQAEHLNGNPYFNDWDDGKPESWTLTGNVLNYLKGYENDAELGYKFSLFSTMVFSGAGKIVSDYELSAGIPYMISINVQPYDIHGSLISNGKTITTSGEHTWSYTPTSNESFYVKTTNSTDNFIVESAVVVNEHIGVLDMKNSGISNPSFSRWTSTNGCSANEILPESWSLSSNSSGLVKRDGLMLGASKRFVGNPNGTMYGEIQNYAELSGANKTYAVLVKMPVGPFDDGNSIYPTGYTIFGEGYTNTDSLVIAKFHIQTKYTIRYRYMDSTYHDNAIVVNNDYFDGTWKWIIVRKDFNNGISKLDTNGYSKTYSIAFTGNTYVRRICYGFVNGWASGPSKFKFGGFYEWENVLSDEEVENIIRKNIIPPGYTIGYDFTERKGNVLTNLAGGGHDATLVGYNGSEFDETTFWNSHMELSENKGKLWMYSPSGESTILYQNNVFNQEGNYDVYCSTYDYTDGVLSLWCGNDKIGEISNNGVHRFSYTKDTSTEEPFIMVLSGETSGSCGNISVERVNVQYLDKPAMVYDHIESIDGIYKYRYIPKHKSNLFSIKIKNSNLNDAYGNSDKEQIQKSIDNIIKNIIKQITPIHTQLFNISWEGD